MRLSSHCPISASDGRQAPIWVSKSAHPDSNRLIFGLKRTTADRLEAESRPSVPKQRDFRSRGYHGRPYPGAEICPSEPNSLEFSLERTTADHRGLEMRMSGLKSLDLRQSTD